MLLLYQGHLAPCDDDAGIVAAAMMLSCCNYCSADATADIDLFAVADAATETS